MTPIRESQEDDEVTSKNCARNTGIFEMVKNLRDIRVTILSRIP